MPAPLQAPNEFVTFSHGHQDVVRTVTYNFYGDWKVTGAADHRLKAYLREEDGSWRLVDTWRAHDAEVFEAKFLSPFVGLFIGSIGNDGKFKIWAEDEYQAMNSGRRFKCVYTLVASPASPYVSFDFKTVDYTDTYVALLARDARLSIYEATEPASASSWTRFDEFDVCDIPPRGEEDAFTVRFDPGQLPCYSSVKAGLPAKALSLVTAGMSTVRIWRTNSAKLFYRAAQLDGHDGLVRDVAWSASSVNGFDTIATACKDGFIRIFEVHTPPPISPPASEGAPGDSTDSLVSIPAPATARSAASSPFRTAPSGIGAGLAGASRALRIESSRTGGSDSSEVLHTVTPVARISAHHGAVWAVKWAVFGRELVSAGDDGMIRFWKPSIAGDWVEFAVVEGDYLAGDID